MIRMIILAALIGTSCAGSASQVEVKGDDSSALALAGDWEGTYVGVDSGRQGTIRFSLTAGHHTAEGVVMMFVEGTTGEPQPLAIEFVEVEKGGGLSGKIGAYTDPQCQCQVQTEFLGDFEGNDAISGTFTTHELDGQRQQSGRWSIVRK